MCPHAINDKQEAAREEVVDEKAQEFSDSFIALLLSPTLAGLAIVALVTEFLIRTGVALLFFASYILLYLLTGDKGDASLISPTVVTVNLQPCAIVLFPVRVPNRLLTSMHALHRTQGCKVSFADSLEIYRSLVVYILRIDHSCSSNGCTNA